MPQMAKILGYERGAIKYLVGVLLTVPGFVSMYIFGGGLMSFWVGIESLLNGGTVVEAAVRYFLAEALPPTAVGDILGQAILGGVIATLIWYVNTPRQGRR